MGVNGYILQSKDNPTKAYQYQKFLQNPDIVGAVLGPSLPLKPKLTPQSYRFNIAT
jgi:hypothetical protein